MIFHASQVFHHHTVGAQRDHQPCEQQEKEKATWMVSEVAFEPPLLVDDRFGGYTISPNTYVYIYMA